MILQYGLESAKLLVLPEVTGVNIFCWWCHHGMVVRPCLSVDLGFPLYTCAVFSLHCLSVGWMAFST